MGGYSEIFRKLVTSIQARTVPAMAVGYQSMTTVYAQAGAIVPLDPLIADPGLGLSEQELADFFPVVLETNRYPTLDNGMYSFPFCKSVLMLYFNKRVLSAAGIDAPPRTWDEFFYAPNQGPDRKSFVGGRVHVRRGLQHGGQVRRRGEPFDRPSRWR